MIYIGLGNNNANKNNNKDKNNNYSNVHSNLIYIKEIDQPRKILVILVAIMGVVNLIVRSKGMRKLSIG